MANNGQGGARKGGPTAGAGGASGGSRPAAGPGGPGRGPGGPGGGPGGRFGPIEKPKNAKRTLLRLSGYVWRQRKLLSFVLILIAISTGLGVLGPWLQGLAIDTYMANKDIPGLGRLALTMIAVSAVAASSAWFEQYIMAAAAQAAVRDLRKDLFAKLQTLSLRFFDRYTHGELMSRLTNDVDNVSRILGETVIQLMNSLLSVLLISVMMFNINWRLALVTMVIIPLMAVITQALGKRTRAGFKERQQHLGELNGIIEETVTGAKVVKAYVRESAVVEEFGTTNSLVKKSSIKAQIWGGFMGPLMNFIHNSGFAMVAGAGGLLAVRGLASVGTIASFVGYARRFSRPLNQIAMLYNQVQSALAGAERVFEVLDEVPEVQDVPNAISLTAVQGDVRFQDVDFSYDHEVPVLKDVSMWARRGQVVALVGPTGAGKTTIVNLLTRFYDIDDGAITVDGHDIRQLKLDDLRRQLGIVLQDTFLFGTTVMENIRYGKLDANDDEVIAAAEMANADPFIRRLPEGYQTILSENGSNLSQGQRQLLAISRAILADPGILILDEATSSVDTRTERHIQEALLRLMEGRTSFVIAHRLSTIRKADAILVINHGEIIERGTHEALLAQQGFYNHMYVSQFKGQQAPELAAVAAE
ncbi:MAG: ABC transporter ATP-binding protein/permease [Anaerolineae bacterium]|nr:ABC transporter ATP-binding protein/permease [Anaerolineae bacterium]